MLYQEAQIDDDAQNACDGTWKLVGKSSAVPVLVQLSGTGKLIISKGIEVEK